MNKLKAMAAGFLLVVGSLVGVVATAAPAQAADLGGVSVWNACVHQNGTPSDVVLVANNVHGWRCFYNGGWNGVYMSVNLSQECKRVHGSSAYANYTNYNNPYSWRCYR
jgi:hypothetical protein